MPGSYHAHPLKQGKGSRLPDGSAADRRAGNRGEVGRLPTGRFERGEDSISRDVVAGRRPGRRGPKLSGGASAVEASLDLFSFVRSVVFGIAVLIPFVGLSVLFDV